MIDLNYLFDLTDGNTTLIRSMIECICEDLPQQKRETEEAIKEQRWKDAALKAHSLKTLAGYLSAGLLVKQLQEIENGFMIPERREEAIALWSLVKERLTDFKNELSRVEIEASDT